MAENGFSMQDAIWWGGILIDKMDGLPLRVPRAVEIHHVHGRVGALLNDTTKWLAISRYYHDKIHSNPSWAREKGYLK